ncbi:hypothetical protein D3C81_570940 [compost metagenome]
MGQRAAGQRVELLLALDHRLHLLATHHLVTLQTHQHVRHADVREHLVVHPVRARWVLIEAAQVGVKPIGTAHAGDQGQVGRRGTKPGLGVAGLHADLHVVTNLGAREHQLLEHQFMRDTQVISHPLVTLELGTVTPHAIVGEGTRTVLHGGLVSQIDIDLVQLQASFGSEGKGRHHCQQKYCNQLFHQPVTLSGTGLVFSSLV